jgi:hypothetical protein
VPTRRALTDPFRLRSSHLRSGRGFFASTTGTVAPPPRRAKICPRAVGCFPDDCDWCWPNRSILKTTMNIRTAGGFHENPADRRRALVGRRRRGVIENLRDRGELPSPMRLKLHDLPVQVKATNIKRQNTPVASKWTGTLDVHAKNIRVGVGCSQIGSDGHGFRGAGSVPNASRSRRL